MGSSTLAYEQGTSTEAQSQIRLALMFYLGWPILFGVILGWTGAGALGSQLPKYMAVPYWVAGILLMRVSLEASTRLVAWTAPKASLPLAALCLLAIPINVYISAPLTYLWQLAFTNLYPAISAPQIDSVFITSFSTFIAGLRSSVVIALEWVVINLVFDRIMNFPRFRYSTGYEPPAEPAPAAPAFPLPEVETSEAVDLSTSDSRFLQKVPKKLGMDISAMSAEDHYVRVYTPLGNDLVLYRFSDAIAELPKEAGFQVHRSHWVRKSAIKDFQKRDKGQVLILSDTLEIPVSKRFIEVVKASGLEIAE